MGVLDQVRTTYDMVWEMNKRKKLAECKADIASGKLPPEALDNMQEAIRLMEAGAIKKDELIRTAIDKWRRMTRKEQQQMKSEYTAYAEAELGQNAEVGDGNSSNKT